MQITARNIRNNTTTYQIARLSNGWLVTCYGINDSDYQFIRSTDNGATWQDLCKLTHTSGPSSDYTLSIDAILADGNNVFVVFGYGDINDNDRVNTVYFTPASVTTATNLYTMRTAGSINPWFSISKAKLLYGRYQYLEETLTIGTPNTLYKRHISSNTTSPPIPGTAYISGNQNADAQKGDSDIIALADGQEWIFYGSANVLMLRRRLTANGTMQAVQNLATLATGYTITRVNVVESSGTHYVFFAYKNTAGTLRGLAYITTKDGLTFTSMVTLLSEPYASTSTQNLDFDVVVGTNGIALLMAIPNGANRLLYAGKLKSGLFTTKQLSGVTVLNSILNVIRAIALSGKDFYFSASLSNGTSVVNVRLDVDGIKTMIANVWTNIEQGYRHNGTTWQEQNGKRNNSGSYQDIT